jgi:putative transposase
MTYPLVRDLADDGIAVSVTCRVLGFSTQGFYKWLASPVSQRDWDDAHLLNAIIDIHRDDPEFGYRFIADELEAAGHRASENRVQRLCALQKVCSTTVKRGRKSGKTPGPAVHDDLVRRNFHAEQPDRIWLTDITEHPTGEGKLYLCAIKDVCSRRIVGYALGERMTSQLADAALRIAITRRSPTGTLIVHSDRGGQFRSLRYQRTLRAHGADRLDGAGVLRGGQRRDGIVLLAAAEQRPQPPDLGHPRTAARRDRDLDRADLPPPSPPTSARPTHPHRVRDAHQLQPSR